MKKTIILDSKWIRRHVFTAMGVCFLTVLVTVMILFEHPGESDPAPSYDSKVLKRGEYLVTTAACNDCHTPWVLGAHGPAPDMSRMLSGHPSDLKVDDPELPADGFWWAGFATNTAFVGPWGISYSANLTPDVNTGLGTWTEDMFVRALRTGRHMGVSRPIQPPMPWQSYSQMTDEDLIAIYAYLRSIPAVQNQPPDSLNPEELQALRLQNKKRPRRS